MLQAILWPVSVLCGVVFGYWCRTVVLALKRLDSRLRKLEERKDSRLNPVAPKPKSVIIDPTDLEQQVKMEQEEMLRKLNPENYNDLPEL